MDNGNQVTCPIPDMGYCLYERCPYWDAEREECDAACLQDASGRISRSDSASGDFPCTITWQEEVD